MYPALIWGTNMAAFALDTELMNTIFRYVSPNVILDECQEWYFDALYAIMHNLSR